MGFSFKVMYLTAAIAFVVCGLIVWLFLPSIQRNIPVVTQPVEILPPPTGSGIRGYFCGLFNDVGGE